MSNGQLVPRPLQDLVERVELAPPGGILSLCFHLFFSRIAWLSLILKNLQLT